MIWNETKAVCFIKKYTFFMYKNSIWSQFFWEVVQAELHEKWQIWATDFINFSV